MRRSNMSVEVRILHCMMCYFDLPGEGGGDIAGIAGVNMSLGLLRDIQAVQQMPIVEVDNTHFSLVSGTCVRVPNLAVMPEMLAATPPGNYMGSYAANAPNTELVWPHNFHILLS